MDAKSKVHVSSEIGQLLKVIVHRPDEGIARITPRRAGELLFDDIVHLPNMQEEHDVFTRLLQSFLGKGQVIETGDLLLEALIADEETKHEIIEMIIDYEELPKSYITLLKGLPNNELADALITGHLEREDLILFDPIPNFIFTRDIAVVVNDHVIITKAAKTARHRENFLTRFIFWSHPIFRRLRDEGKIINLNHIDEFPPSRKGETVSIEGGDVMVINKDYILIGCSERTSEYSIHSLRDKLFEKNIVQNVVQINIPADRTYMHIDTIFTQINTNHIIAYKPIIEDGLGSYVDVFRKDGSMVMYDSVKEFVEAEINPDMQFIYSAKGESPYQEREQWTDGCNLVALKPGVAITYDRNPKTEEAFKEFGYSIITAKDFLAGVDAGTIDPAKVENTIITIPSNELSRARGGSHCMTCPIERKEI